MFDSQNQEGSARRLPAPPTYPPQTLLSVAAGQFLHQRETRDGNALRTVQDSQSAIWYVIEFAGRDAPIEDLPEDFAARWIEWLRMTPWRPRKAWSMPRRITPQTVRIFFAFPPPRGEAVRMRREQTVGRFWRHGARPS